jgi:hypothetical protein
MKFRQHALGVVPLHPSLGGCVRKLKLSDACPPPERGGGNVQRSPLLLLAGDPVVVAVEIIVVFHGDVVDACAAEEVRPR